MTHSPLDPNSLEYLFDTDNGGNGAQPRILDLCYMSFMNAHVPNKDDGGPSDWFTDTKPMIAALIRKVHTRVTSKAPDPQHTLDSDAATLDPQPYLHVLHMDGGQKEKRLTFTAEHPFGRPGRDYSEEFEVTSVRLKPEDHPQNERAMDIVRRAAKFIDQDTLKRTKLEADNEALRSTLALVADSFRLLSEGKPVPMTYLRGKVLDALGPDPQPVDAAQLMTAFEARADGPRNESPERTCRGSMALGTACGKCARCRGEQSVKEHVKSQLAKVQENRNLPPHRDHGINMPPAVATHYDPAPKHQQDRWFWLDGKKVKPFNGETIGQPSWSHGFTHFHREDGTGGHCGVNYFANNADLVHPDEQGYGEFVNPAPTPQEVWIATHWGHPKEWMIDGEWILDTVRPLGRQRVAHIKLDGDEVAVTYCYNGVTARLPKWADVK